MLGFFIVSVCFFLIEKIFQPLSFGDYDICNALCKCYRVFEECISLETNNHKGVQCAGLWVCMQVYIQPVLSHGAQAKACCSIVLSAQKNGASTLPLGQARQGTGERWAPRIDLPSLTSSSLSS